MKRPETISNSILHENVTEISFPITVTSLKNATSRVCEGAVNVNVLLETLSQLSVPPLMMTNLYSYAVPAFAVGKFAVTV